MRTNFGQSTRVEELSVGVASLALAGLTYHYIEWPIRALRQRLAIEPFWLAASGAVSCATIAVVGYVWAYQIAPNMRPQITGLQPTRYSEPTHLPILHHGILLGDSHANSLEEPLEQFALREGANLRKIRRGGCLPLLLIRQRDDHDGCGSVYNQIEFKNAEFVIFAVRWNSYLGLPTPDPFSSFDLILARPSSNRLDNPYDVLEEVLTRRSSKRCAMAFREFCSSLRRRNFLGMLLIALCNPFERALIFALSHGKGWKTEEGGLWLFCSKSLIDIKLSG